MWFFCQEKINYSGLKSPYFIAVVVSIAIISIRIAVAVATSSILPIIYSEQASTATVAKNIVIVAQVVTETAAVSTERRSCQCQQRQQKYTKLQKCDLCHRISVFKQLTPKSLLKKGKLQNYFVRMSLPILVFSAKKYVSCVR